MVPVSHGFRVSRADSLKPCAVDTTRGARRKASIMFRLAHAAAIAASAAALVAATHVDNAHAATSTTSPVITWTSNRPCPTEDSVNCAWNAQERGNGRGHSFIVRQFPGRAHMVCVMYDERRYAATHDYCEVTR